MSSLKFITDNRQLIAGNRLLKRYQELISHSTTPGSLEYSGILLDDIQGMETFMVIHF